MRLWESYRTIQRLCQAQLRQELGPKDLHMAGKISDDFLSGGVREAAEGCIDIREVNVGNLYESRHLQDRMP